MTTPFFRKGQLTLSLWITFTLRLMFMILVLVTMLALVRMYFVTNIDTSATESLLFTERLLQTPGLLSSTDPLTGENYVGTLDMANFNTTILATKFALPRNDYLAEKLPLVFLREPREEEIYFNPDWYHIWKELLYMEGQPPKQFIERRYVLVKDRPTTKICDATRASYPDPVKLCMTPSDLGQIRTLASGIPHYSITFEQLAEGNIEECCTAIVIGSDKQLTNLNTNSYDANLQAYTKPVLVEDKAINLLFRLKNIPKHVGSPNSHPVHLGQGYTLSDSEGHAITEATVSLHADWPKVNGGEQHVWGETDTGETYQVISSIDQWHAIALREHTAINEALAKQFLLDSLHLAELPAPSGERYEKPHYRPAMLTVEVLMS